MIYFNKVLSIPKNSVYLWYNTLGILISALLCIPFGMFSDRYKKTYVHLFCLMTLTIILALPIFYIYTHHIDLSPIAFLLSSILNGFAWGIIPRYLSELFPTEIRYSGVALSYNLGFAIFAGLTPLMTMFLIYKLSTPIAPAIYLIGVSVVCIAALWGYLSSRHGASA